jgi:hypothetical protein
MKLHLHLQEARYWYIERAGEKLMLWFVWKLPRKLVMWCYVRVGAHATTGQFGSTNPSELGMMEALKRWDEPNEPGLRSVPTA